jgi:polygalacturonase
MTKLSMVGLLVGASLLSISQSTCAQATLPADFAVAKPQIPSATFNIVDYGAVGDGKTLNTAALGKAIAACEQAGGGTVEVPAGMFLTGPFALASNLNLHLDDRATIKFSDNRSDFRLIDGGYENCLVAQQCHDLAITGTGTIDGNGSSWWTEFEQFRKTQKATTQATPPPHRPYMIMLTECTRVMVQGVTLANSPMFHFVPRLCRDVTIDSIKILSPADSPNTDGIDPSGWNYQITHCTIDTGDDNIALKPRPVGDPPVPSCQYILVEHCTFLHGHGMSIGGGSNGGVRDLLVRDCTFEGTKFGVRLKSGRDRGGLAENLTYENLTMHNVESPILITSYYPQIPKQPEADKAQPISGKTPIWRHVLIKNVVADGGDTSLRIIGLAEMPVQDVTLENVRISAQQPPQIIHAQDIRLVNSQVSAASGAPPEVLYSHVDGLEQQ